MCCLSKSPFRLEAIAIPKAAEIEVEEWLRQKRRKYSLLLETGYPTIVCSCENYLGQYFMPYVDAHVPNQ
jgi:hypothetical protein